MPSRFQRAAQALTRSPLPLCVLVAIAGGADALVMLHSKELLAVYMTGNSTRLGQSLIAGAYDKAVPLVAVITCFFFATTAAAWIGTRAGAWRATLCLALTAAMLMLAMPFAHAQYSPVATCLIAAGMGAMNQARADQPGVTFITGSLVKTGRELAAGQFRAAATDALRWVALIAGAGIGTLLDYFFDTGALAIIALIALLCALATTLHASASVHQSSNDGGISHARE